MTAQNAPRPRPLSPHLEIYRVTITMVMSIVHRITGTGLYIGVLLMAWFLIAMASGPGAFATFSSFASSIIGQLILFGFTWSLFNHMLGGIRHIVGDTGRGLDDPLRDQLAWGVAIGGFGLAIIVFAISYGVR
jgi:succinate dehydrogenase / fumarate reductase, cytochrome b subunit